MATAEDRLRVVSGNVNKASSEDKEESGEEETTGGQVSNHDDEEGMVFVPSRAYATRKTLAQGALDLALLMANASQLKALVDIPSNHRRNYYVGLLIMLVISILLQVATGLLLLILGFSNPKSSRGHRQVENMNNASVCLILLITVVNVFISAFGISFVDTTTNP